MLWEKLFYIIVLEFSFVSEFQKWRTNYPRMVEYYCLYIGYQVLQTVQLPKNLTDRIQKFLRLANQLLDTNKPFKEFVNISDHHFSGRPKYVTDQRVSMMVLVELIKSTAN